MDHERSNDPEAWRGAVHGFLRRFGLLESATTPCGKPMPTSHAHALMELLEHPDMTQNELAECLGLMKSTISRLVARLEQDGKLVRTPDKRDRRVRRLRLTAKGRRVAQSVSESSRNRFQALMGAIPAGKRQQVLESLDALMNAAPTTHTLSGR